jgi:hypothetical protein
MFLGSWAADKLLRIEGIRRFLSSGQERLLSDVQVRGSSRRLVDRKRAGNRPGNAEGPDHSVRAFVS